MGVILSKKKVTPSQTPLKCDGVSEIELTLTAANELISRPVDIILALDESTSMQGAPLTALKAASKKFVEIIDEATNNGTQTGTITGGTKIGIVKFSGTATFINPPGLTTNVSDLKTAIDTLVANDGTCQGCAFLTSSQSFDSQSTNPKIIILFTDGNPTVPGSPNNATNYANTQATAAKNSGIEIYCIGLGNGINQNNLNNWATDSSKVLIAPTPQDLIDAFEELASNLNKAGATNIQIIDTVEDDFEIVDNSWTVTFSPSDSKTAEVVMASDKKSITLKTDELGTQGEETMTFKFQAKHISCESGTKLVNKSVEYSDTEQNNASFIPFEGNEVEIDCTEYINSGCCDEADLVEFEVCEELKEITETSTLCAGRLLSVSVKLTKVCPERKVAIGVIVYEKLEDNSLEPKGFRATEITTPAITETDTCVCKDIEVKPFDFVLPEEDGICKERSFYTKVIAHYSDSLKDYEIECVEETL